MIEEKEDKQGSATATLLCIPDISWFIEFMGSTDLEIALIAQQNRVPQRIRAENF